MSLADETRPAAIEDARPMRSPKLLGLWIGSFGLLGLLGFFCLFFLKPYLEVRGALRRWDKEMNHSSPHSSTSEQSAEEEVVRLGGPKAALKKLTFYSRLPDRLAPDQEHTAWLMGYCGPESFPVLISLLKAGNWGAADALGMLGDKRAFEPLLIAFKDRDWQLSSCAAYALGRLGDKRAFEPLIVALKDTDVFTRRSAASALGRLGDERAVEPLITALKDPGRYVPGIAARSLGHLGDPRAVEPLIAALKDTDSHLRSYAVWALGMLGDERAIPVLEAIAANDAENNIRVAAAEALRKIRAVPPPSPPSPPSSGGSDAASGSEH